MTSTKSGGNGATPPEAAGEGMDLLIGWRAGGEAAAGAPAPERSGGVAAEPGAGAAADPAATMTELVVGQQRILALLKELTAQQAETAAGDAGAELGEAARSIAAATEWASDIRAAMDSLLVTAGKSIRDLEKSEQGLAAEVAALKTREEAFDRQIETLAGGARTLTTRLRQLDEARQKLEARSAELQSVKQDIVGYYEEWTGAALAYRQEMAALTKRLDEGENLVSRVEKAIGPWTVEIETSLDENAKAQKRACGRDLRKCAAIDRERRRLSREVRRGLERGAGGFPEGAAAYAALVGSGAGGGAGADGAGPARDGRARPERARRLLAL